MRYVLFFLWALVTTYPLSAQIEHIYPENKSLNHKDLIANYQKLDDKYETAKLFEIGQSDQGLPIHLFVIDQSKSFDPISIKKSNKAVLMINNGIHAGEPCGIDASLKLADEILLGEWKYILEETVICIIPAYNIGGLLNRGCCSRVGQNGPLEYGFRGNAKNLDLNRDFIKTDSKNMRVFTKIFHQWDPDVFIDTHTTNGSDHQYTMTLLTTQKNKLDPALSALLEEKMLPDLYQAMSDEGKEMIPYVNTRGTPETGIIDYLETPRYSTGFAALFNTIGFVTEALKYKPYPSRVEHTLAFEKAVLKWMYQNKKELLHARSKAKINTKTKMSFDIKWELDTTQNVEIDFKGYESKKLNSKFGEQEQRLQYDSTKPYTKKIKYYNTYKAVKTVTKPKYYLVPQSAQQVIDLLQLNNIQMSPLQSDSILKVQSYYIEDYKTVKSPYEGHYLHYDVELVKKEISKQFYKGDY
ncbi:MAG: M14 family metallopeptidase, partial [Flavobacteriales bacterium]|nr:M14 family metallopeptidase [Flavobacteriales bacterium]